MAIGANSYGDTAEIAKLTPVHANTRGVFDPNTRPALSVVESLVDQVSALVNMLLEQLGFSIPVTEATVKLALDFFVNQEVASLAEGINGSGRFGPTAKQPGGKGRFALIMDDVKDFLEATQFGIESLGVTRDDDISVQYSATDESGDAVAPLFQREAFGNKPRDWDA